MKKIEIYSDGWARPNPGPWGYGVILRFNWTEKEFSWFDKHTTNNRMELTWVIVWLSKLKEKCKVKVFTDSSYVVNGIEKWWAEKWKSNNWMRTKSEKAINFDLWEKLLNEVSKHDVQMNWVKWHAWHIENERVDVLATNQILKYCPELKPSNLNKDDLIKKVLKSWNDSSQKKIKIQKAWDKCRKCWVEVIKAIPKKKNTKNKSYYYKYYLNCPGCSTNYFVDDAKVII